jgi:hypothetical protein
MSSCSSLWGQHRIDCYFPTSALGGQCLFWSYWNSESQYLLLLTKVSFPFLVGLGFEQLKFSWRSWPWQTGGLSGKHSCGSSGICAGPFMNPGTIQHFIMKQANEVIFLEFVTIQALGCLSIVSPSPSGGHTLRGFS